MPMQILHPFAGSVQQYLEQLADPDRYRPNHCPQCQAKQPLTSHGFYTRTIIDTAFDGVIRVRRYLCQACRRTVSLLPEFALPYFRSSVAVIALFLVARLLQAQDAPAALPPHVALSARPVLAAPFSPQAEPCALLLPALTEPPPAPNFVRRALPMLDHRLDSRSSLPVRRPAPAPAGLASSLVPDGRRVAFRPAAAPA